ncbi:ATP-binding cassette sub-family C member 9-like [Centruroides sculpturatus]|uniref:ATP-binding cassette sub-family C member 9-like n=1 Tax=Centruroides sculpturatus TaxID=218467 RepID=UPI000C6DD8E0|nr:ATP-binding cassette sub-family C member 9-like [Centruroides sculpturatus]
MGISTGLDTGAIVNHMSVDAFNMMMLFSMGHYIWAVPFKITLLLILLYMQLGYSALIGAATIYILAPLQYYICSKLSYIQKKTLEIADDRLKRINELLQGIKILKLYGWEIKYANQIETIRDKELKLLKKDAIYVALNTFITQASSIIVTLVVYNVKCKLTAIVGPVGSGKSSLLSVLLGELHTLKGNVQWSSTSYVAYVPQKPWLLNATLKENILFGQPYNGRRYHQVIQACALQADINLLPCHDLTEIGERGVNLSGGQRQRIALARAFYSQARLVILDDPLSALDAHVESHVFEQGIKTLLLRRQRTVILVTNKLEHLTHAAKVILMEDNKIKCQGSYSEIEKIVKEQSAAWKKIVIAKEKICKSKGEEAVKDRHKFSRLLSKQVLHRATSTQEIRPRARLVSLSRQLSHDPSSPLPCHDCGDHDDPIPSIRNSEQSSTNLIKSVLSTDSLRSRSSTSSVGIYRHPWKTPMRLNSRISVHTEEMIEEEEEQQLQDESGSEEKLEDMSCGKLIKEEERERGKISKKVYLMFMKACSLSLAILVIILIISTQAVKIGADFWLSKWSELSYSNTTIENDPNIKKYVAVYALLSGVGILLSLITNLAAQLTSIRAVKVLFSQMLNNIIHCPMRFFDTTPIGRILNRFSSDMNTIDKKLPVTLPVLLRFLLLCISAIIVDVVVTPYFLAAVVPIMAIYYFIQHYFRFSSRELQRLDSITKSPVFSHFSETISGLTTIRAYREEKRFNEMLTYAINNNNAALIMVNSANCWLGIALDYLGGIILFVATIAALTAAITNKVSSAFVGMAMTYTLLVPIYLNWVVRNLASVEMYMNAVERVKEYSQLTTEDYRRGNSLRKDELIAWLKDWPNKGQIIFENVTLKYDENLDPVLKNVSLNFASGEKVGICGRTGSGKSSLVMAIFRILLITDGNIYIDGVDIKQIPLDVLRSRLSIIPQDIVLFSGTVRENLDPNHQYRDEELWNALKVAQLYDLVISLPGSLDAELNDEGSYFSVGQRQLFCLARAILKKSKILIMDEATSSLDPETDQVLQKVVASNCADCTVLTIAHRISGILSYDRVIVLDSGHIVETGHPIDLLQRRGSMFASLVKASEHA